MLAGTPALPNVRQWRATTMPLTPRSVRAFRQRLLAWFRANRREHPWRRDRSPYRVWLAEVMLQQTRIAAVIPYYEKFLARFPTVESLSRSPEQEVLRLWAGLGYYSRARNLQRAAREIVAQHDGSFPRDFAAAIALPGIGRYTAAAVLSIAFDAPHAVLDGNVARVLARLDATRGDLRAPQRWKKLETTAQTLLAPKAAGDWNQAMMELGETICTPKSPQCGRCPVARWCEARKRGLVDAIPAPRKKQASVTQRIAAAVLLDSRGRTLLVRDPGAHDGVLFSRMWQFPAVQFSKNPAAASRRSFARASALRSASTHRTPACKARSDVSRHHASAILRSRRDAADSPAHAPPPAGRHRPRAGIQRDEKNCEGRAGTHFLTFNSVRFTTEKRKRATPPRAARLGGRAPTYNTELQYFVATQTAAQEHQPAAVRPSLDDVLRPASPCSRPEPGRAMTRVPSG